MDGAEGEGSGSESDDGVTGGGDSVEVSGGMVRECDEDDQSTNDKQLKERKATRSIGGMDYDIILQLKKKNEVFSKKHSKIRFVWNF